MRRFALLEEIGGKFSAIKSAGGSSLAQLQELAAYLKTRAGLTFVGVDEQGLMVSVGFPDGRVALISNNRTVRPLTARNMRRSSAPISSRSLANELPKAEAARVLHAFGPNFEGQDVVDDLQSWLRDAGYKIRAGEEGDARLTTLRQVRGDGFLYINCHGGTCRIREGIGLDSPPTENKLFALQSSSLVSAALDSTPDIQNDFANQRLVYFFGEDWRYAITHAFVDHYWQFAPHSVVILNACHSGDSRPSSGAPSFIFALHKKGAGAVFGWTESVSAVAAYSIPRYFVDRLLGANKYRPESPEQRAFAWDTVLQDMETKGLVLDPAPAHPAMPAARFVVRPSPSSPRTHLLAPSLRQLQVNEYLGELVLTGLFGADLTQPRRVEVDGALLEILKWEDTRIVCRLPATGAGSAGPVAVRVGDRRSNFRLLTEWQVLLSFTWAHPDPDASAKVAGDISLRFRADVEPVRDAPGEPPRSLVVYAVATKDSRAQFTASGVYRPPGASCAESWSGEATFPSVAYGMPDQRGLIAYLRLSPDKPTADLSVQLAALQPPFRQNLCGPEFPFMVSTGDPDGTARFQAPADQFFDAFREIELPSWKVPFRNYVLEGTERKSPLNQPRITWKQTGVRFPPLYSRPPVY